MLTIRPATAKDRAELHAIRTAAFAPVFAAMRAAVGPEIAPAILGEGEDEQGRLLDGFLDGADGGAVLVALDDGLPAGFAAYRIDVPPGVGELVLNAVTPDRQGRGIGTALFEAAMAAMRDAGASVAAVGVGGDETHAAARAAYRKAGFTRSIPSLWLYRKL